MIASSTFRQGSYAAAIAILLALTGVFGKLDERQVVTGAITLSMVLLAIMLCGAGFVTASRVKERGIATMLVNGVLGSLIVGAALVLVMMVENAIDLTFVFAELKTDPITPVLTFGQTLSTGIALLLVLSALAGSISGGLLSIPAEVRRIILLSLALTASIGLLEAQIKPINTLPDALTLAVVFGAGYVVAITQIQRSSLIRLGLGLGIGAIAGLILGVIANGGGFGVSSRLLSAPGIISQVIVFALIGGMGSAVAATQSNIHNGTLFGVGFLLSIGVLNWQDSMSWLATLLIFAIFAIMFWLMPRLTVEANSRFETQLRPERQVNQRFSLLIVLLVMLVAPLFLGQYITSIFDLVGLYIIMGIGLNIAVGYTGLLVLGFVAFFALGAYTVGTLTTPSLLTCGGILPADIARADIPTVCTGVMTFWQAWPIAVIVSMLAGVVLGIPVLRLRGDYLAIVTLGFGEIIRLITLSGDFKPIFGGAQGIGNIPVPVVDLTFLNPAWRFELGSAFNIYYLILFGIVITAFVAYRLGSTRLGRAWRAIRADEDVARAMGINLTRAKLLSFAVGASFAGLGGAIFGSWLQGIFPNSFTVLVSINVLALIIIGGLGSIPGVMLGAVILVGLPEILRELQDYRLLAFGVLLVVVMLARPEGLIPPPVRRLSEQVDSATPQQGKA
jgi:branched-chain amino acid transport system permease protein